MDLDGLGIQLKTFLLVGQELLNIFPLISLQLNHLAHLSIANDSAIAGCSNIWLALVLPAAELKSVESAMCLAMCRQHTELLLDNLQNLLLIKFLGKTLDRSQGLTTIALCSTKRSVTYPLERGKRATVTTPNAINSRQMNRQ